MKPIICQNNAQIVINKIQEFVHNGGIIKDICVIDQNESQVVFLIGDKSISKEKAQIWWSGYSEGLKAALE